MKDTLVLVLGLFLGAAIAYNISLCPPLPGDNSDIVCESERDMEFFQGLMESGSHWILMDGCYPILDSDIRSTEDDPETGKHLRVVLRNGVTVWAVRGPIENPVIMVNRD